MSGGIKPSFVFPTEARAQTRNNNSTSSTSHTWPTQSNAAVPVPPPPTLRQTATTTSNQIIAPTITSTSSRMSVSLSTQPALPRRSASLSSNGEGGAANGSAPLPAPPPPPARRYREMGATPVLLPECLTAATNGQIMTAQLRHGSDGTQPRRRKSGDAGPQSQTNNHHSSTSISSGTLPSIPAHLQKRSSTVQTASQGRPWQQQQPLQRRRSSVNAGSANSSTTAPPPTAAASMTASEEPTRVPTGHAARRSVSFIVPDEMARPGLSEFSRTLASATQGNETIADMHRGTASVQEHQTPQTEAVPAPGFATPIIVHRPPTRGNGRVEENNTEQSAGQMPASLGATERRSKASNNNNSNGVTASTPQKAEGGLSATLSFRDRVNKGVPPPPRTRLQRRRPGKRRTPQGSLSGSVASSSTTGRTGERRRRGLGHTSTSLLGHGLNGASGLHNEADWQRVHALRVLLYVTWFHTRMMRIVRRARAQQHWQRVLAPRAAFVLQCLWRRVRQRRRVEKLCAVRLLVPWLRLKLTRLRQAKEASARLLQRVFRAERTRVWMRGLYDCMYVHRALRILQRHVRRWEDQKLLRFLRSQREERNLMIERCRHESTRLVRNERAGWLTLLRMAHEQLGFTASDPTAVTSHVDRPTSDKIVNSNDEVVQPVVVCLASPLHTLETCQAYLTQLFTPESENYLSAYKAGNTPHANAEDRTTEEATITVVHEAVTQISSNNDDAASSGDGVLDAFVELLGRVETMERKELERDLLHEHALFCEPVRRISYAIRLRSAVPRLYASLLLSLPTVADMRRAVELFHAEQRARTLIIAEYNAIPLLALHRPGFSATAEQRHRTLLALMSLADANGDATHYTPVDNNERQQQGEDTAVESASLALYDEQQAGQSNTSDETNLLRQMKAAVQANTSDHVPSNDAEESATPKPRRLRVMMQPQLTPVTAPGAISPVPLLQMRSQLLQVRRRQRISLSAITDSSAHTSHNEDDDTTYVNVPVESTEEEVTAIQEKNNKRSTEEQQPLPLRSSALTSSNVSEHERKWQAGSRSVTASDNDDSVSAMESVGWGAAEVSEQTASKSSTTLNTAVSTGVVAPPQPPSPPPRRRHRSQFESAASVVSGPFAAEHDTQ